MYEGLKHAHSGLRWVVLILLIIAVVQAFRKWQGKAEYTEGDRKLALYTLIAVHVQLIIGLVLYFFASPNVHFTGGVMGEAVFRFYTVEHFFLMILAIVLVTIGYSRAKKKVAGADKFKTTFIFYGISLLLILLGIPWPFRGLGAGWF